DSGAELLPVDGSAVVALEVGELDAGRWGGVLELNGRRLRGLCLAGHGEREWKQKEEEELAHVDAAI
ncbi:MAG: hypothetical protein QOE55_5507, partial [Acidobacteriaceae bacterium]|nr:hypothetical protein [Acidobacteriaceae bacterium]